MIFWNTTAWAPPCSFIAYRYYLNLIIKGALDKYNIIRNFLKKSWEFCTMRSVGMGNDSILSFTF